jgi:hypothetical protein
MTAVRRWDPCIAHRAPQVDAFIAEYFSLPDRRILLVAGAGFDPRSTAVATRLTTPSDCLRALFIQENRRDPAQTLIDRSKTNTEALLQAIAERELVDVEIFGADGAVTGGRNIIKILSNQKLDGLTDVAIDISALSVGTSFPIIRFFVERAGKGYGPPNIHVFVVHDPKLDAGIRTIPSDSPGYVHGFRGGSTLDGRAGAAKLWLPQLATGRRGALGRLYDFVEPHEIHARSSHFQQVIPDWGTNSPKSI